MIILFLKIHHSAENPGGSWNIYGFLGESEDFLYATKEARQMKGVARIIDRVAGIIMG